VTVPKTAAEAKQLVDKLWSYCHVLRHDGVSTIDYVDQLTLLLFLKMAQERVDRKSFAAREVVPRHLSWQTLLDADADELKFCYENIWRASHIPDSGPYKVRPGMEDATC
jgi:type I restriction enzyme M protein